ncbi:MAG TPA: hypothetical protein VKW04_24545 [Planctomycetota bacterium]|nr:hypothetical protein [Planctomycetota bacterium]
MSKLLPLLLFTTGCGYLSQRAEDFADCWKVEVHLAAPGVWMQAGPVAQDGLGAPELPYVGMTLTGWRYGYQLPQQEGHSKFPVQGYGLIGHFSSLTGITGDESEHRCFVFLPSLLSVEGLHSYPLHDFDVEIGASAILGFSFGFSMGEFLDFLLGWFGVDLAKDDGPDQRRSRNEAKSYYRARAGLSPVILPREN